MLKVKEIAAMSQIPPHAQKAVTGDGPASTHPNLEPWFRVVFAVENENTKNKDSHTHTHLWAPSSPSFCLHDRCFSVSFIFSLQHATNCNAEISL